MIDWVVLTITLVPIVLLGLFANLTCMFEMLSLVMYLAFVVAIICVAIVLPILILDWLMIL